MVIKKNSNTCFFFVLLLKRKNIMGIFSVIKGRATAGASRPMANLFRDLQSDTANPTANDRVRNEYIFFTI